MTCDRAYRVVDDLVRLVGPYRRLAGWWALGGTLLAGGTAPLAATRLGLASAVPFVAVAIATTALAVGCWRSWRWAMALTGVVLGTQVIDVIGALWAVTANPASAKTHDLRTMGINPRLAFAINALYSSLAVALAAAMVLRARATDQQRATEA
jgi:hypothetical protein